MRLLIGLVHVGLGAATVVRSLKAFRRDDQGALAEQFWSVILAWPTDLWVGLGLLAFGLGLSWYEIFGR